MQLKYIFFLFSIALSLNLTACTKETSDLRIGVISDIHYLSKNLMDDGVAINNYMTVGGKSVKEVPDVLNLVINDYLASNIDILLIPGDLTKDGEKESHIELISKLQILKENGTQIFVIPGNHDINMPNAVGYRGSQTYPVDNIDPTQFVSLYADFGFNSAIERDSASLSYLAELDPNTWLLAIDACKYEEYKDRSISSGRIKPSTETWILNVLEDARRQNKQVVGMMHQGLVEHIAMQAVFFKDYIVEDWQRLAPLFADNGMKVVFTGHFHANDITQYVSSEGNELFDIETGSLSAYPFPYRFVQLEKNKLIIETKNITATPQNSKLAETSKQQLKTQAEKRATSLLNSYGVSFPDSIKNNLSKIASEIFIKHIEGDEVVVDNLKEALKSVSSFFDDSSISIIDNIQLDFYPADNNLTIEFDEK